MEQTVEGGEFWWDCTTIREIIQSPVYLGHTASQKTNHQFKVGWLSDKPMEEWIIVEDTHEPIIDQDTYDLANEKVKSRKRPFKTGEESIFAGLVKCPDCGKALNLGRNKSKNKEKLLTCNTYRRYGKALCTQHRIYFDTLYQIVLKDIQKNAEIALKDEQAIIRALEKGEEQEDNEEQILIAKKIEEDSKRVAELGAKVEKLYDDWIDKKISENNFQRILEKTQREQDIITERIKELTSKLSVEEPMEINVYKWIELIKKHKNIKKLDKETLNELISKIYVHEKEIVDGEITQIIEIHYNFIGNNIELKIAYNL